MRKYWYLLLFPPAPSEVQLKAHLSFSFGLFRLGLAAGNLLLMFGQFTIQVRNYITAPTPSLRRVGDYAVRPILVGVWRCEVMSDAVQLPVNPHKFSSPPQAPHPSSFTLPCPSGTCTVTDEENARRGGYVEGHCKVRLWYKSICNRRSLQVFL